MNRREAIAALTALPALKSIARADVGPNDVIVAECEGRLSTESIERIRQYIRAVWPTHRVVVCDGNVRLKVMKGE